MCLIVQCLWIVPDMIQHSVGQSFKRFWSIEVQRSQSPNCDRDSLQRTAVRLHNDNEAFDSQNPSSFVGHVRRMQSWLRRHEFPKGAWAKKGSALALLGLDGQDTKNLNGDTCRWF